VGLHDDAPARRQHYARAEPASTGSRPFGLQRLVILQRAAGGRKPANGKFTLSPRIRVAALSGWEQDGRCSWQTAHQARRIEFLNGKTTRESGRHDPRLPDVRRPSPRCGEVYIVLRLIYKPPHRATIGRHDQADRPEWVSTSPSPYPRCRRYSWVARNPEDALVPSSSSRRSPHGSGPVRPRAES
jgi:hypothetical protein